MLIEVGRVEAIFRYPVKSMAGERLELANLGWRDALRADPALLPGLHTHEGVLTCAPVAEAHGLPWTAPEQVLT